MGYGLNFGVEGATGINLPGGQGVGGFHATATDPGCNGDTDAILTIQFQPSQLAHAVPKLTYTGTLTLTVEPE